VAAVGPTWTTSSRLLKLGETITFSFVLPATMKSGDLSVYACYLEQAEPGKAFRAGGGLEWLEILPRETFALRFVDGRAAITYTPTRTGSYLAGWRADGRDYYRYFSVIDDAYIVLSFSTFNNLESEPTFHALGIPLDYRLPVGQFRPDDSLCRKLLAYNRTYGDLLVPELPDMLEGTHEARVRAWGDGMNQARELLPDPLDHRSARLVMRHNEDPGYTRALVEIGINDHCGLQEANCRPWLGMPEFLYYSALDDCRRVNGGGGGTVVAHQWDFCGSFHFLGPVQWHYAASEGDFTRTVDCIQQGMTEFKNLVDMSRHPVFITPLYDGVVANPGYPNPVFSEGYGGEKMFEYVERYQRLIGFELPKQYKVVFARSIDVVDYFRKHFEVTPRTVFVSKTRHLLYDAWWSQGSVLNYGVLYTPERIPWVTRLSTVRKMRDTAVLPWAQFAMPFKDPMSCEFILIEDAQRQIRFERGSPNPIWWFDCSRKEATAKGSIVNPVATPDVLILRSQAYSSETGLAVKLKMQTDATFPGYAIALWGVPVDYGCPPKDISTNATRYTLAKSIDNETHLVLYFDLKPDAELEIVFRKPRSQRWDW
jgi:hypothetical protein